MPCLGGEILYRLDQFIGIGIDVDLESLNLLAVPESDDDRRNLRHHNSHEHVPSFGHITLPSPRLKTGSIIRVCCGLIYKMSRNRRAYRSHELR
jgi:hypothetical protein